MILKIWNFKSSNREPVPVVFLIYLCSVLLPSYIEHCDADIERSMLNYSLISSKVDKIQRLYELTNVIILVNVYKVIRDLNNDMTDTKLQ